MMKNGVKMEKHSIAEHLGHLTHEFVSHILEAYFWQRRAPGI